jgi:hypothetical protein
MSTAILPPPADEYASYYGRYISRVPPGDLFATLAWQPGRLRSLLGALDESGAGFRPGPAEWSIKEVVGHLCDWERIFGFRALCFARGDQSELPGLEPDDYVREARFDGRTLADLLEEFELLRRASVLVFRSLAPEHALRIGTASGNRISVRALLYLHAGHVIWHMESLETDYLAKMV